MDFINSKRNRKYKYLKHPIFKAQLGIKRTTRSHRIVLRKVTKFIIKRTLEDPIDSQKITDAFLKIVKPLIVSANVCNSDQSSFQLKIHSGRSLSY